MRNYWLKVIMLVILLLIVLSGVYFLLPGTFRKTATDNVVPEKSEIDNAPLSLPRSSADLTLKFLRIAAEENNSAVFAFSPFTLIRNMVLVYAGANGETKRDLSVIFNFNGAPIEIIAGQNGAEDKLLAGSVGKLELGNLVAGDTERMIFSPTYLSLVGKSMNTAVETVNFSDPESAAHQLNMWVDKKTHSLIPEIIAAGDIEENWCAAIFSALYFGDDWKVPFNNEDNLIEFQPAKNQPPSVMPAIVRTSIAPYAENDAWKYVEIECSNSKLTVALIMPREVMSPKELVHALNGGEFTQLSMAAASNNVHILIPEFKIENTLDCKSMMVAAGMNAWGDLAPMGQSTNDLPLEIGAIKQKNFFEFSSKGVVAASVTVSVIKTRSAPIRPEPRKEFIADHPFLWFLYDKASRTVLLGGWFSCP